MTDRSSESVKLVQELRDEAILRRHEEPNDVDDLHILFDRAADEIERLNADLASSREQLADLTKRWGAVVDDRDRLRAVLDMINMLACYASEENTDSRAAVLLQIGKLARGEVSPEVPESPAETGA